MGLSGQKLIGVPVIVQPSQAEKNRVGNYNEMARVRDKGPMRLYVGSLHFNITEDMLRGIFEPFGKIQSIQMIMDPETGRSKGYGFVTVSPYSFNSLKNCVPILYKCFAVHRSRRCQEGIGTDERLRTRRKAYESRPRD